MRDFRLINHSRLQGSNLVDPMCRRQNIPRLKPRRVTRCAHQWAITCGVWNHLEPTRAFWRVLETSRSHVPTRRRHGDTREGSRANSRGLEGTRLEKGGWEQRRGRPDRTCGVRRAAGSGGGPNRVSPTPDTCSHNGPGQARSPPAYSWKARHVSKRRVGLPSATYLLAASS